MAVGSLSHCESCRNGCETPTTKLHTLHRLVQSQQQVQQLVPANVMCTLGRWRNCADTLGQAQLHRPALTCHSCVKIREIRCVFQDAEDQEAEQEKGEEGQSSVTVENGEQSQFESEKDCRGERQVGESQSHHGLWSCGPRDA